MPATASIVVATVKRAAFLKSIMANAPLRFKVVVRLV
jgi:hypothetical protein